MRIVRREGELQNSELRPWIVLSEVLVRTMNQGASLSLSQFECFIQSVERDRERHSSLVICTPMGAGFVSRIIDFTSETLKPWCLFVMYG